MGGAGAGDMAAAAVVVAGSGVAMVGGVCTNPPNQIPLGGHWQRDALKVRRPPDIVLLFAVG